MINKKKVENFIITLSPKADSEIENLISDAISLATNLNIAVEFKFCDVWVLVNSKTTQEEALSKWRQKLSYLEYLQELKK